VASTSPMIPAASAYARRARRCARTPARGAFGLQQRRDGRRGLLPLSSSRWTRTPHASPAHGGWRPCPRRAARAAPSSSLGRYPLAVARARSPPPGQAIIAKWRVWWSLGLGTAARTRGSSVDDVGAVVRAEQPESEHGALSTSTCSSFFVTRSIRSRRCAGARSRELRLGRPRRGARGPSGSALARGSSVSRRPGTEQELELTDARALATSGHRHRPASRARSSRAARGRAR
jgi:hypothetical protein